jgi:hypothetical protein
MKIGVYGLLLPAVGTLWALQLQAQSPQNFVPVTPCRVVDTRGTQPGAIAGGFIPGNSTRGFAIPSVTYCPNSIPSNVTAYSLNVTVVPRGSQLRWITLWPTGQSQPVASTLNSYTGLILANNAIVPAGTNGSITAYVTEDTDVVIDINGYFTGTQVATGIAVGPGSHAGAFDVAIGNNAGGANETTGTANMAIGAGVLSANTSGSLNVGVGNGALISNTTGNQNTAIGAAAAHANTSGNYNVAIGASSLQNNQTGLDNVAIGFGALQNVTGSGNIAIGASAGQNVGTGSNNIDIGAVGPGDEAGVIRIGDSTAQSETFIAGIATATVSGGTPVVVNSSGQLGIAPSSVRFKEDIKDMGEASDKLMLLRPVTFHYKQAQPDGTKPLEYGLIAEEVAKIYPELVVYDKDGRIVTVQYQKLPAMLLNEVQRQHAIIDQQTKEMQALQDRLGALESTLASQNSNLKQ